jgi:Ca-activated chloride channel homolog
MSHTSSANPRRSDLSLRLIPLLVVFSLSIAASGQSSLDEVHIVPRAPLIASAEAETMPRGEVPLIKKSADLVLVPVTVTDTLGRLVTGLRSDNFQIFEDKKPQEIRHFSSDDAPVSIGIIVDTSGSMADKMERVREAVQQFHDFSNPQDEFFVITFSDEPHLMHDFSDSSDDIEGKLLFAAPKGRTALLDAVYMGIKKMREAKYNRKALLIVSDGGDNHSRYSENELKSVVKEADVTIYAIGIFDRNVATNEELLGPQLLSDITEITGGRAFILDQLVEMPALAQRIGVELRTQYMIAYQPTNPPHDGRWRRIRVKLKLPKKLAYLQAQAKQGYYASHE